MRRLAVTALAVYGSRSSPRTITIVDSCPEHERCWLCNETKRSDGSHPEAGGRKRMHVPESDLLDESRWLRLSD